MNYQLCYTKKKNSNFKLYTYDGDNCIIDPIAYTPSCNILPDGKMDEFNPITNTCQTVPICKEKYVTLLIN